MTAVSTARTFASVAMRSWGAQSSVASCSYKVQIVPRVSSAQLLGPTLSTMPRGRAYSVGPADTASASCRNHPEAALSWSAGKKLSHTAAASPSHQSQPDLLRARAQRSLAAREDTAPPSPFLRDRHNRQHTYLRMSLTERCNLRCMYCMPLDGVPLTPSEKLLDTDEVERIARLFVQQGVNKIRLTGGEPTLRKDLPDIIDRFSALRPLGLKQIGITTNGLTIPRHIHHLVASGLTHLNVSLDTLDPFKFELMTRRPAKGIEKVLAGIEAALALGVPKVKINVVVVRGLNDGKDVLDFVEWVRDRDVVVRFIEYMPFDGNRWRPEKLVPYTDLLANITRAYGPLEKVQDDANDTSKHWRVPGHKGSVGFITSMTDHFCGTCNRLRVTADGNLKVCLFGNAEVSLRDAMRGTEGIAATDDELLEIVGAAVRRKHARHAGMADPVDLAKEPTSSLAMPRARAVPHLRKRNAHFSQYRNGTLSLFSMTPTSPTLRLYSTATNDPWDELDAAADAYTASTKSKDATATMRSDTRPQREEDTRSKQQTWSSYMGTDADGDDSPWASLDAFADSQAAIPGVHGQTKSSISGAGDRLEESQPAHPHQVGMTEWDSMAIAAAEAYAKSASAGVAASGPPHVRQEGVRPNNNEGGARLTHTDPEDASRAAMVDVGNKGASKRVAEATCRVYVDDVTLQLLEGSMHSSATANTPRGAHHKGPVLHTAQLAGIMGAKRTSELIPLCHGLNLSHVDVRLHVTRSSPEENASVSASADVTACNYITVTCTASTVGSTGVEMEALTGASIASLTLWDMLKSVGGRTMRIEGLHVSKKTGGKSGDFVRDT